MFKIDSKEIILRLKNRITKNKYDKEDLKFHKKIIIGYNKISKNKKRFVNINAKKDKKTIHFQILKKLGFLN